MLPKLSIGRLYCNIKVVVGCAILYVTPTDKTVVVPFTFICIVPPVDDSILTVLGNFSVIVMTESQDLLPCKNMVNFCVDR